MHPRTRDIEDGHGTCLRISAAPHPGGAMVTLERRDQDHLPSVLLSLYGAEILGGFIMSARLSAPWPMPEELVEGVFSVRFRLHCGSPAQIVIEQEEDGGSLAIDAPLWDRLYAELCLVTAHGREWARRMEASLH